uniref:AAA+ ATPase domain-containing protein n=1 Tax=Chromera velia CCMP2878 TaxID=1169474 RepID=A0A0G4GU81_9ALVE|eukprot:Cvel_5215.t1-p1 / transcript=Cvel_5215.t1 / gene=Cvel_5215 / organism=Chromera_velia_CCMP2878 / gene_product=ATP-dependent zinc metalloprotease FTSH 11,, putative / transcript_product=ATP-dependent zinc metalloprotease FTSH 11,, putative / location=Cvel_scaffold240:35607-41749(-) / protein_length=735 / sequence_SO=supercontig / SO=protein_coding / is_pseudo=false
MHSIVRSVLRSHGWRPTGTAVRRVSAAVREKFFFDSRAGIHTSVLVRAQTNHELQRRIWRLESEANDAPDVAYKQKALLALMNRVDPRRVITRYESGDFAVDEGVTKEYIKALVLTGKMDHVDLRQVVGGDGGGMRWGSEGPGGGGGFGSDPARGLVGAEVKVAMDGNEPLKVQLHDSNKMNFWRFLRSSVTALILVAAVSVFAEGVAGQVQKGFGMNSKKQVTPVESIETTFDDVKGCDEVKDEVEEIILYLRDPEKFAKLGAKLPKGMLLSGSPGTGKTLLARAIAGEAKVPFIQASGSEFEEMFVGVGARRIRDLFSAARKHTPCIVFIDEIDAVGSKRSNRDNTAVRMTLNQLLVELDGFEQNKGIVVICATNFPESLDAALTRPGRLDKNVVVPLPDLTGRRQILQLYAAKMLLAPDVDLEVIAKRTAGMTGAELFNILNIAAVHCAAKGQQAVSMEAMELAFDRVVVGLERRNPMSEEEKKLTAYHEGGHTIVSLNTKGTDPIHKATIMPRGQALGITWQIPAGERYSEKLYELRGRLDLLMGGKAAEELVFGKDAVTAGCMSDLRQATGLARRMVMQFGMGLETEGRDTSIAPMFIEEQSYGALSNELRKRVDEATERLLKESYERAHAVVKDKRSELDRLAMALLEFETLDGCEIRMAVEGNLKDIRSMREKKAKEREERMIKDEQAKAKKKKAVSGKGKEKEGTVKEKEKGNVSVAAPLKSDKASN